MVLEQFCRFSDLKESRIVQSHAQLRRLQETEGFPRGRLIGPNTRVWTVSEINTWLEGRPTEQSACALERAAKSIAARKKAQGRSISPSRQMLGGGAV
jgi:predicted DNA-binding transcriptional regulator AlpA